MQQYAKGWGGGGWGVEEKGERTLVARATMGLFWALDFADDENHFPAMLGLSLPPLLEAINAEPNILGKGWLNFLINIFPYIFFYLL